MIKLKYFYSESGVSPTGIQSFIRLQVAEGGSGALRFQRYLCGTLASVASTIDECEELLEAINKVENGKVHQVETGCDNVTLTIKKNGIQTDIDINDDWIGNPEGLISLRDWRLALEGWRRFLTMPRSSRSIVEVNIE